MTTRQNEETERDDLPPAQTRATNRGAGFDASGSVGDARATPTNGCDVSGLAARRWGRRLIAWGLRRSRRLARRGRTSQALRIMLRLADLAPDVTLVHLFGQIRIDAWGHENSKKGNKCRARH
jgi:hypothetical protein